MKRIGYLAIAAAIAAAPAQAQQPWEFTATGYLWLPTTKATAQTPRGSVSGELSVSQALEDLKFAAMGTFEARSGRLSLVADLVYFNVAASRPTPFGVLFSEGTVDTALTAVTLGAFYRLQETGAVTVDVGAGLRGIDSSTTVTLSAGNLPTETYSSDASWIDPVIALRARADFNEKWYGTLYLDAGGTGSSSTSQAGIGVGYRIDESWAVVGGWRYLDIEKDDGAKSVDVTQSGVIVGVSYNF